MINYYVIYSLSSVLSKDYVSFKFYKQVWWGIKGFSSQKLQNKRARVQVCEMQKLALDDLFEY
jgi:hypothetical protein